MHPALTFSARKASALSPKLQQGVSIVTNR
jgi:hypothetical protein